MIVDPTGLKVPLKYGDSRSNCSRDKRLPQFVTNDDNDGRAGWSICRLARERR